MANIKISENTLNEIILEGIKRFINESVGVEDTLPMTDSDIPSENEGGEVEEGRKSGKHMLKKMAKSDNSPENKRKIVINWLKDPSVNCAEIMRKLWRPSAKEEDGKRSYFYKCRDGKPNDEGVPYRFSDKEINRLFQLKSHK